MQKEIQDSNRSKSAKRSIQMVMEPTTAAIYLRKSSEEENHSRADQNGLALEDPPAAWSAAVYD